jgi:3-hydroxybutyryl-CoA dehydrogenase
MSFEGIRSIAVIGAGTMGQGIAQVCAVSGFKVLLYDVQPELIQNGIAAIRKNLDTAVEKAKITADQKTAALNNIIAVSDFRNLQVEMAVEAVIEKLEVKQKLFVELEKINDKDCILATNTSSIPITQIASALKHQGRVAGLHFFNPAPIMKLVEVVQGASTEPAVVDRLMAFAAFVGKKPVIVKDSPGFIVNRVARHFYVESLKLVEDGVADIASIDKLMRAAGFKMGPFELMDLIGVDTNFSVTTSIYQAFHQDPKFRPSRIQQQKVDAGHWGRKTGKGFYDYTSEQA